MLQKAKDKAFGTEGKDRTPGEASSVGFGHKHLAKHSEASYDQSNPGYECTELNRDNLVWGPRAKLGPDPVEHAGAIYKRRLSFIQGHRYAIVSLLAEN